MTGKPHVDAIIDHPDRPRIEKLWAYVCVDKDGKEGLAGGNIGPDGAWLPFIGSDAERMQSLRPFAERLAQMRPDVTIRFVEFTGRIDHGIVGKES